MPVLALQFGTFQGDSQCLVSVSGAVDGNNAPLVNTNYGCAVKTVNAATGAIILDRTLLNYVSAGSWSLTLPFSALPEFTTVLMSVQITDPSGFLVYAQQDILLTPVPLDQATFSRNSFNTFTFPRFGAPGGALLDNTNSTAVLTLVSWPSGAVLTPAPVAMAYVAGAWVASESAPFFPAGPDVIAVCAGKDLAGAVTYRTQRLRCRDGG